MTVRECYEELGSDFDKVLSRLVSEALVKKFALKFLNDPSFGQLKTSIEAKDAETAFRAAHTLKGICLNLGFDNLFAPSQELTEKLRGADSVDGTDELLATVEKEYNRTCDALRKVD
ncbi:Hpt domain-containing protein [Blautia sp. MSJ-19]|uniref:Hpt domain-containing protein n=1 Tax=Blautia sp. MSJ-19 TaxID=2841517 RepID=UPI001C0E9CFC|nr:Hpt domain-containing protein [Blautia sp. MSJ-19]MBU5482069.1 Hpt domain-containing protein [Blautia sp. MSJ-19]